MVAELVAQSKPIQRAVQTSGERQNGPTDGLRRNLSTGSRDDSGGRGSACRLGHMKRSDGSIGTFRARVTRDAAALERDGERYFAMNRLVERYQPSDERALFEFQFGDGV